MSRAGARRSSLAVLLGGGWLLLHNPEAHQPMLPLSAWKPVDSYETALLCEAARREEVASQVKDEGLSPFAVDQRYRCERAERVPGR